MVRIDTPAAPYRPVETREYRAWNGHLMVADFYVDTGRMASSSAFSYCAETCPACAEGDPLPDY